MKGRKFLSSAGAFMLLATSLPLGAAGPQAYRADAAGVASAPVNQFPDVAPDTTAFNNLWDRTDSLVATGRVKRSWLWGPQAFWTTRELYVDDPQHTETRLVQYWDKSRMEVNDPNSDPKNPFYVTNGLLSVELISGRMQTGNNTFEDRKPANINIAGDVDDTQAPTYSSFIGKANAGTDHPDASKMGQKVTATLARSGTVGNDASKGSVTGVDVVYYDDVTHHNIPKAIWDFLNLQGEVKSNGQIVTEPISTPWFYATGRPISDAYWSKVKIAGKPNVDVLIQAFERRVVTYTPSNPTGFQLEMGNIGAHYRDWRYIGTGKVDSASKGAFPLQSPHIGYGFNAQMYYVDKDKVHKTARDAGFTWLRQQVSWQDLQSINRYYAWGELDNIVEGGVRNRDKTILSIAKSPKWASPKTNGGMPDNPLDFGNLMYMMARRYKGKVQAYEIWNEQNLRGESGGPVNVAQYIELLKIGYSAIKFADPDAVVLFGGLTPTGVNNPDVAVDDVRYLEQAYAFGGGVMKNYFDVLGAHPGSNSNTPDQLYPENPGTGKCPPVYASQEGSCWRNHPSFYFRRIEQQRTVMEANGDAGKQMWLTEFGWSTYNTALGYEYGQLISPKQQADYLVRAFQKGKEDYPWMGVMCVWNLNFSTLGLPDSDEKVPWSVVNGDYSPRLAFLALKAIPKN